jgi:hypothetical protein
MMASSLVEKTAALMTVKFREEHHQQVSVSYVGDYSTDISHVFKFSLGTSSGDITVFAKIDKNDSGLVVEEYENISAIKRLGIENEKYKIPEIALFDRGQGILALKECRGTLFLDYIRSQCMWRSKGNMHTISSYAKSLGLWLSHYESHTQESCAAAFEEAITADFDQYAEVLRSSWANESIWKLFLKCEAQFFEELRRLEYPVSTYLSHGDFHPGNFFIEGEKVTAIDFQQGKRMLNGYDALYCELNSLLSFGLTKYRPAAMKMIRSSFLEGYHENGDLSYRGILKPMIVVRALVYLSTVVLQRPGLFSYLLARLDMKTASSWLAR